MTPSVTFTMVEYVKKISLFAKKIRAASLAAATSDFYQNATISNFSIFFYIILKLVSSSTSVVSFNAIAFVIRCWMGFLFNPHPTDINWKYPHFEKDKKWTYKNIVREHEKLNLHNIVTANWHMTPSLWHLFQATWNKLRAFSQIKHGITRMFAGLSTIKISTILTGKIQ